VKPSHAANDTLIDRTRQVWQSRLGRNLNREDARQIVANMTGFLSVLAEWSHAERPTPANDPGTPAVSEPTEAQHER
jgi:hypothetical protein